MSAECDHELEAGSVTPSDVDWRGPVGVVIAPCSKCGEYIRWTIEWS